MITANSLTKTALANTQTDPSIYTLTDSGPVLQAMSTAAILGQRSIRVATNHSLHSQIMDALFQLVNRGFNYSIDSDTGSVVVFW